MHTSTRHTCIHAHTCTHTYTHTLVHTSIHTYMHTCPCRLRRQTRAFAHALHTEKNLRVRSTVFEFSKYTSKLTAENFMQADTANNELCHTSRAKKNLEVSSVVIFKW